MKKHRSLLWQLFKSHLAIVLVSLLAIAWLSYTFTSDLYYKHVETELKTKAQLTQELFKDKLDVKYIEEVDKLCSTLNDKINFRITIILPFGKVIGDSQKPAQFMDNHADRPEIISAMQGEIGISTRFSNTVKKDMMYVALPYKENSRISGVFRTSMPIIDISETIGSTFQKIIISGFFIALLAAMISLLVSNRLKTTIGGLKNGALEFAKGNLSYKLPRPETEELDTLSKTMTDMAGQLGERIREINEQREELEAVLYGMVEAVIVVNNNHKILRMNKVAASILGVDVEAAMGKDIMSINHNGELNEFIKRALEGASSIEDDIIILGEEDLYLSGHGTPLNSATGERIGALLVLHDVTRLKKLEQIRKDFVANVSHELKTPITSIKVSVETLIDGNTNEFSEDTKRFLNIILKHTDRLNLIIEDLLSLSRVEQSSERQTVKLEPGVVSDVIDAALLVCDNSAKGKNIEVITECDPEITALMDPLLLEQAIINLLDNAIKYSGEETIVKIVISKENGNVLINVKDHGRGIPAADISRIFERFYRVDKARSRKLGGTGLGLAIVKHIANVHKGDVCVVSEPNVGSTFTIRIKAA